MAGYLRHTLPRLPFHCHRTILILLRNLQADKVTFQPRPPPFSLLSNGAQASITVAALHREDKSREAEKRIHLSHPFLPLRNEPQRQFEGPRSARTGTCRTLRRGDMGVMKHTSFVQERSGLQRRAVNKVKLYSLDGALRALSSTGDSDTKVRSSVFKVVRHFWLQSTDGRVKNNDSGGAVLCFYSGDVS